MMKGEIGEEDQGRHRGVVLKRKKALRMIMQS